MTGIKILENQSILITEHGFQNLFKNFDHFSLESPYQRKAGKY